MLPSLVLQNPEDSREAFCDESLQDLLGQTRVHCLMIRPLLTNHLEEVALQQPEAQTEEKTCVEM